MTKESKKYYSAPIVKSIKLDSEICLILMTNPPPDPGTNTIVVPPSTYSAPPSASSTPFGGNGPDYSDM